MGNIDSRLFSILTYDSTPSPVFTSLSLSGDIKLLWDVLFISALQELSMCFFLILISPKHLYKHTHAHTHTLTLTHKHTNASPQPSAQGSGAPSSGSDTSICFST